MISKSPYYYLMFNNKDLRLGNGETLNEVDKRFINFINEKLDDSSNNIAIFLHGIILLSYLGVIANETFDGKKFEIEFNGKNILNGNLSAPDIYQITYDNKKVIKIERIEV